MAKRKGKKDMDWFTGLHVILVFATYAYTHSVALTLTVFATSCTLVLSIMAIIRAKKKQRLKRSGIQDIDKMTGIQFEEYLRTFFTEIGYKVKNTPKTGDYGADLILEKAGKRIVVQAKRYKKNVGIKAVQEAGGAKAHYRANESWVITNSNFTQAAFNLSVSNDIRMIGREQLIEMILQLQNNEKKKKAHPSLSDLQQK